MSKIPLEGIKIISFGVGIVVPDMGKTLGQLGADVIKIESNIHPDFMRTIVPDPNNSPGFNESNRNHRVFGVNLKTDKGKDLVLKLVESSDIMIENYRGDVMEDLGFDYESVRRIKPDIIYLSSQGFGKGGPYSEHKGYGPTLTASSGLLSLWRQPEEEFGCGGSPPHPDNVAAWQGVLAVLAALDYRRRTGIGQHIDLAQVEVAASLIGEAQLDYTVNGRVQEPIGNRSLYAAPHNSYKCKGNDKWCVITVFTDDDWERFCNAIGNPEWTRDSKFSHMSGRLKNVEELDQNIEAWTLQYDPDVVMQTLQAAGVAASTVQRAQDMINDPQLQWRGAIEEMEHPVSGNRLYPSTPFNMTDMSFPPNRPAPILGQHTEEICREELHMSDAEIEALKSDQVLETPRPDNSD
ncbi:MAG: CoA transferase [Deltaproteobacteria bacterium]|nr:CoA transferase [Deltaproteobacteria bacterium]